MKQQILDTATEMFLTLGFKSVTMDDIAAEMAISKKTIYQHYATKPALIEAVTVKLFTDISNGFDEIAGMEKNAIEELYMVKDYMVNQLRNESTSPIYQLQKYFPKVFKILKSKQFNKIHSCVIANINKGLLEGLYRESLDVPFVTRIFFVGGSAIKDNDIFPTSEFKNEHLANKFLDYHIRAIASPKGLKVLENYLTNNN